MPSPMNFLLSTPSVGTSDFAISMFPPDPYVGETFSMHIDGDGSHTGLTDELEDIYVESNMDEAGVAYKQVNGISREVAFGRDVSHAFDSDPQKDIVTTSWTFGGGFKEQTTSVTPLHPDAETWTKTIYCDASASPSAAGWPAEDANIEHALGEAAVRTALHLRSGSTSSDKYRVILRGGVDHVFDFNVSFRMVGGVFYFESDSASLWSMVDSNTSYVAGNGALFWVEAANTRVIVKDQHFRGNYDPLHGIWRGKPVTVWSNFGGRLGTRWSFYNCRGTGMAEFFGVVAAPNDIRWATFDCNFAEWENFAIWSGNSLEHAMRGVDMKQFLFPMKSDNKNLSQEINAPDHGGLRVQSFTRGGVSDCRISSRNGWSGSDPRATQPPLRVYSEDNTDPTAPYDVNNVVQQPGGRYSIVRNQTDGAYMADIGRQSIDKDITYAADYHIFGNKHSADWFNHALIRAHCGGVRLLCNELYLPDMTNVGGATNAAFLIQGGFAESGQISASAWTQRSVCQFNTVLSDKTDQTGQFYSTILTTLSYFNGPGDSGGQTIVEDGNTIAVAGTYSNAGSLLSPAALSRGGGELRNVTGGAADTTLTSGPPADLNGLLRSNPTQEGAYHASAVDTSRPAPTNSVVPTIGIADSPRVNTVHMTDIGTWANIDDDENHMISYEWFESTDGTNFTSVGFSENGYVYDGSITHMRLNCTRTNKSGISTTVTSNTLAT